ncbi:hypothetical protein DSLASN_02870 [Desulfoluna limicola]|uniref:Uncharacterized protein n=1 Tax=Desulfoluna limicola TaxID=2810562 RepID=A0ABM7PBT4_9BACT|nr:hypothetical protein DSLASN_02870 [Desulfoluna limicola]
MALSVYESEFCPVIISGNAPFVKNSDSSHQKQDYPQPKNTGPFYEKRKWNEFIVNCLRTKIQGFKVGNHDIKTLQGNGHPKFIAVSRIDPQDITQMSDKVKARHHKGME